PRLVELNGSEQDTSPGPEARALRQAQLDDVTAALAGLPPRYREAVVLRYVQDLSYDEAAQVLGQPVGMVKSNVHRTLKLLSGGDHDRADDCSEEAWTAEGTCRLQRARAFAGRHRLLLRGVRHGAGLGARGLERSRRFSGNARGVG